MLRIGFDIGGTNIDVGAVDEQNRIVARRKQPFPKGRPYTETVKIMEDLVYELLQETGSTTDDLASIGIGIPGSINASTGTVISAHNLGFYDVPMRAAVGERFPATPVFLNNDANTATLAEFRMGALRGCRTGILLTLGTGVGGGLILCGEVFEGGLGHGVELGHMCIDRQGPLCTCGNRGCAETLCSATWLEEQGKKALAESPSGMIGSLARGQMDRVDGKVVIDAAKTGDPTAMDIFNRYVDQLSTALSSYAVLLDPEVMVLGGGVSDAGEFLLEPLRQRVKEKSFFHYTHKIVAAEMGNDAGIIGAALLR